ncbi:hypothetical protein [Nonlabens agnitus]|uniref:Uncharacterized protein n=1 Tax=Nonlabens agnitus TaxID=870484 RepID=A0A2S9WQU6_9FLAO|nr:hypothetical protein [Nonlabens agnitus]PRP65865.1 hypothetical protein BST86_01560 [Nonlabens agnitus]
MPYSGGSAINGSVWYQNWYLALEVARSHFEANRIIYTENFIDIINIIDDIKIVDGKQTRYFKVKFRSPNKNLHWGIGDLSSQNIITHLSNNLRLIQTQKLFLFLRATAT